MRWNGTWRLQKSQGTTSKNQHLSLIIIWPNNQRSSQWKYNQFLCGNAPVCTGHSPAEKQKAAEIAKHNIANNFFLVGILEQFIDTLHVFEKLMPSYYSRWGVNLSNVAELIHNRKSAFRAVEALNSQSVQQIINATKTQHKTPMSDASKNYFRCSLSRFHWNFS